MHVRVLFPPLEHAPDQTASRPLLTLSWMDVPTGNVADPVLPTGTLTPAGLESTRSPLRPVAVTVSTAAPVGGGSGAGSGSGAGAGAVTPSDALRVTPA